MVRRLTFQELCERNPNFKKIFTKMDSNWVKEDGPEMATGNVFKTVAHNGAPFGKFADQADKGVRLKVDKPGKFEGDYGTLILRKDGTYKYTLFKEFQDPAAWQKVQGLSDGETLREVFRYKVTNGYLKKNSLLKITIFGMDDEVLIKGLNLEGAEHCLFEADLPGGSNMMGQDYESEVPMLPMVTGSFDVCARDGFKFLKIGGVTVIDANGVVAGVIGTPIMTQYGELIITGITQTAFDSYQIDYKYTLTSNTLDHTVKGPDSVVDSVVIELEDQDGSHATDALDFEIKDDLPVAKLTLTGAMLLVDETDGVAADMNETDVLGGDLGMSMLTANQAFNEFPMFGADGEAAMGARAFEFVLSGGEGVDSGLDDHEMMQDIFLFTVDSQTIEGRVGGAMGPVSFTLTITTDGKMTLTQSRAVYHDDPTDHDEAMSPAVLADDLIDVQLSVTDGDGDMDMVVVALNGIVKFEDDGIYAKNDYVDDVMECGHVLMGDVTLNDTIGQDTPATVVAVSGGTIGQEFAGLYGKLTIESDGKYTYTSNDSVPHGSMDTFTYTLQDSDGDQSTATLKFTFSGDKNMPTAGKAVAAVDDDGLMGGNAMSDAATDLDANAGDLETMDETIFQGVLDGSFGKDGAGGFCFSQTLDGTTAMLGQETVTYTVSMGGLLLTATGPRGELFTVAITDALTGAFTLTLLDNVLHIDDMANDENDASLDIPYVVKDSDGSEATGTLTATFDDDVPLAVDGTATATESCAMDDGKISGNVLTDGITSDTFGADGPAAGGGVVAVLSDSSMNPTSVSVPAGFTVQGAYGELMLMFDGSYMYTPDKNIDNPMGVEDVFTYTIEDADGDQATATLTITVEDGEGPTVQVNDGLMVVDEDGLQSPTADHPGTDNDGVDVMDATGSLTFTAGTDDITIAFGDTSGIMLTGYNGTAITWTPNMAGDVLIGTVDGIDVIKLELTGTLTAAACGMTTVGVKATLLDNLLHVDGNGQASLTISGIAVTATDTDGDEATGNVSTEVVDDVGEIKNTTNIVMTNTGMMPMGMGVFEFMIGADYADEVFCPITNFTGTVGTTAISNQSIVLDTETPTTATFDITFDYAPDPTDPTDTTTATGTLVFDKTAGTYTVKLDAQLEGFSVVQTSDSSGFFKYDDNGTTTSNQPPYVVLELETDFFVRLSAAEGNNPGPDLTTVGDANAMTYVNGATFVGAQTYIQASNDTLGVAGDTLQNGEVLNLDFFVDNPEEPGMSDPARVYTDSVFIDVLQFDATDDILVILKLFDGITETTRALNVGSEDVVAGRITIESNDYNGAGESFQICGMQILTSAEDVTGQAIDLIGTTGDMGGSDTTNLVAFETQNGNEVIKVTNVGFITTTSGNLDASLSFDVALEDDDGDKTAAETLTVTIEGSSILEASSADESLNGADGMQTFVFDAIADSPAGTPDIINGFMAGTDKLDFSGLAGGSFAFQGETTSITMNSITWEQVGSDTVVRVEATGDTMADIEIVLADTVGVSAADIIGAVV